MEWLKEIFGCGYIRHRKTGISDYTIVESEKVGKILQLLQPFTRLKKKQIYLGLQILQKLKLIKTNEDFFNVCEMVDRFRDINYSKKRTITSETVKSYFSNNSLPL